LDEPPLFRLALFRLDENFYKLVWTYHHILLDGRSIPIVLKEVFEIYEAISTDKDILLEDPPDYRDYIDWFGTQDISSAKGYWQDVLKGFSAPTPFGIDRRQIDKTQSSAIHGSRKISITETKTAALQAFAKKNQITLNTILQGVWAIVLSRYSGEDEVVFGAVKTIRNSINGDINGSSMVGLLINTLPMRVPITANLSIITWLKELRSQWISLRRFENTPLMDIQAWSDISPGKPLFESLIGFENQQMNAVLREIGGLWSNRIVSWHNKPNFPLIFSGNLDIELLLKIYFDKKRFDVGDIQRMLCHISVLLDSILENPDQKLLNLQFLTEKEKNQILVEWNKTDADYPREKCVHELFEEKATKNPDNIAIIFENQSITYQELNTRANQVGNYLQRKGVAPEVLVGVCMGRSQDMIVNLLGILKAGGAYVPLDPQFPTERLNVIIEDANISLVVTQDEFIGKFRALDVDLIVYNPENVLYGKESYRNPEVEVSPKNLVYSIYTSGSTGKPKGVAIQHRSLVDNNYCVSNSLYKDPDISIPVISNFTFDVSVTGIFSPLMSGGTTWIISDEIRTDPYKFGQLIASKENVGFSIGPTFWSAVLDVFEDGMVKIDSEFLTTLILGTEKINKEIIDRTFALFPEVSLWNLYGPTETTINATWMKIEKDSHVTIGRPVPNTQVYILDANMHPLPVGVPGILYIGGERLARGYLNSPSLTAESFLPNPFGGTEGSRIYNSGDLAKWNSDGLIDFLGRIDQQVKIRGFRVELGEIESVINQFSEVKASVVIDHLNNDGSNRLVAYMVLYQDFSLTTGEIQSRLHEFLPDYMVPSFFIFIDSIPLTPSGKIDRRSLPVPESLQSVSDIPYTAPRTPIEESLAEIWQEVLNVKRIGIYENFFRIGGNSLSATRVLSRIINTLDKGITLKELFENLTIAELAAEIEERRN